ncbi:hypothetical protein ASF27_21140 [Methylobacterium sp. Leaf102]|nr:hypothetical protein ASF27_21140 [Methylobacterium sp. Leaf102]
MITAGEPDPPPGPNFSRGREGGQPNESVQKANAQGKTVIGASAKKAQLQELIDEFDRRLEEKDRQIEDQKSFEKSEFDRGGDVGTSEVPELEQDRDKLASVRDTFIDARDNIGPAADEFQKGNYWPMLGLFAEREPLLQVAGEGLAGRVASKLAVPAGKLASSASGLIGRVGTKLGELAEQVGLRKPRPASRPSPRAEGESIKGQSGRQNGTGTRCTWPCTQNPVALADGAKVTFDTDFALPGVLPIELTRSYASDLSHDGPLGRNRIGSLDEVLVREPDGSLLYRMGSGLSAGFDRPSPNIGEVSRNAKHPHLTLAAGRDRTYVLRDRGLTKLFGKGRDGVWRLAEIRDPNDQHTTFERDAAGLLLRVERFDGFAFDFENDARGLRMAVTLHAPGGETRPITRYAYDARGNMTEARNSYGPSFRYEYDAAGRFFAYEDGVRTRNTYAYDEAGRVVTVTTPGGRFDYRLAYGADGRTTTLTYADRPDGARRYTFDANGRALSETDTLGRVRRFERDALGTLLAEIDPEGNRTAYAYDAFGTLSAVTDPEGRRTAYHYDEDGRLERLIDPTGQTWEWSYDGRGNLVSAVDPLGYRTDYATDEAGLPTANMRHDGLIERRDYDAQHNLVRLVDYRGGTTLFERDAFGRLTARTDPLGQVTRFAYDERPGADFWTPTALTRPDGVTVRREAEPERATLTLTEGEGRRTRYRYGPFDLLESIEDPKGGHLRFTYDGQQRLTRVKNQLGRHWTFARDAAGRVVEETDFDGMTLAYAYDRADRVTETRYPDAARTAYVHDRAGLLVRQEAFGPAATVPEVTRFAYDRAGRIVEAGTPAALVRLERDALGRVIAETQNGRRIESTYDCCGNRVERRMGERRVATTYDPLGAPTAIAFGEHAPLRFTRDAAGRETLRESAAGFRLEQGWDAAGQLTRQRGGLGPAARPGQALAPSLERVYAWDRSFAPSRITDARWGETVYGSDPAGQIAESRFGDGEIERFAYDPALNLSGLGDAGSRVSAWQLAAGGRVERARGSHGETVHLSYDACRRVVERRVERSGFRPRVWRYGWDAQDRLVACETPSGACWAYGYDAFGRRVSKQRLLSEGEEAWVRGRFPSLVRSVAAGGRSALDVWAKRPPGRDAIGRVLGVWLRRVRAAGKQAAFAVGGRGGLGSGTVPEPGAERRGGWAQRARRVGQASAGCGRTRSAPAGGGHLVPVGRGRGGGRSAAAARRVGWVGGGDGVALRAGQLPSPGQGGAGRRALLHRHRSSRHAAGGVRRGG